MPRVLPVLLMLFVMLLPLGASAAPPAPAAVQAIDEAETPIPATPGPLDLYLWHSPACHICRKIVALTPDMQKLNPELRIIRQNNTVAGATQRADELRKKGKIPAEIWGPATAVFLGDGWTTAAGTELLDKIHALLEDRAEVAVTVWKAGSARDSGGERGPMQIIAEFRVVKPLAVARSGWRDALSFPALVGLFLLLGAIVLAGGGPRVTAALGLGYWAGAVVLLAAYGLGELGPSLYHRPPAIVKWAEPGFYLLMGVVALALAAARWRAYRRMIVPAPSAADGLPSEEEPSTSSEPAPAARRSPALWAVVGFLVGVAATLAIVIVIVQPPAAPGILAEVWALGELRGRVLEVLAAYLGGATGPLLVMAVFAWVLAANASLCRRGREKPAEYRFAALVFFLVVGVYLVVQAAVIASL